jgi:hypothetical protein
VGRNVQQRALVCLALKHKCHSRYAPHITTHSGAWRKTRPESGMCLKAYTKCSFRGVCVPTMATLFSFPPSFFNSASPITKQINHAIFWTAPLLKKVQKAKNLLRPLWRYCFMIWKKLVCVLFSARPPHFGSDVRTHDLLLPLKAFFLLGM